MPPRKSAAANTSTATLASHSGAALVPVDAQPAPAAVTAAPASSATNNPSYVIAKKLLAGVGTLAIASQEERRVLLTLHNLARRASANLVVWRESRGFSMTVDVGTDDERSAALVTDFGETDWDKSPQGNQKVVSTAARTAYEWIVEQGASNERTYFVFLDLHRYFELPLLLRLIRDVAQHAPSGQHRLFMVSGEMDLPKEWQSEIDLYRFPMSGEVQLSRLVAMFAQRAAAGAGRRIAAPTLAPPVLEHLVDALSGLTFGEAESVLSVAFGEWTTSVKRAQGRTVMPDALTEALVPYILEEKQAKLATIPGLKSRTPKRSLEEIGGNAALKRWLTKARRGLSKEYITNGGDAPKGCLLLGPGGTGKSAIAEAIAHSWGVAFFELNIDELMDSKLGESETRLRGALQRIEAQGRCILFVDELDKSVASGNGETDGNTSGRMLGVLLKWLARDREQPVFVIFAANRIHALPPELVRAGRLDAKWVVLPPNAETRASILRIHLKKRGYAPDQFAGLAEMAATLDGYTGAELEQVVKDAMLTANFENDVLTAEHLQEAAVEVAPASRSERGKEEIARCQQYVEDRFARYADAEDQLYAALGNGF